MQRWRTVILSGLTLVALFCAGLAVHSGVDRWKQDRTPVGVSTPTTAGETPEPEEVDVLWGTVYLNAPVELSEPVRDTDAYCAQGPAVNETVFRNDDGSLRNVVVVATWEGSGDVEEPEEDPEASEPDVVGFELSNCDYYPHVARAHTDDLLYFSNKDQTFHVLVILDEDGHTWFRRVLKPGEQHKVEIDGYRGRLDLTCGAHPWEHAFVQVAGDELVAVTDEKGRYALTPEKTGTYRLVAWHERFGEQVATVDWEAGALEQSFTFSAEP